MVLLLLLGLTVYSDAGWWDSSWKYRKAITFQEQSGRGRAGQWVNVPVVCDPSCENKAYDASLRLVASNGLIVPIKSIYNVTYCPTSGYLKEAGIEFRFDAPAYSNTTYYLYYTDNSSIPSDRDGGRKPVKVIWADYGAGAGPDKEAYRAAMDASGYAGMYDEYDLSAGSVPPGEVLNHSIIIWAQAGRYSFYTQDDCDVLYDCLKEGASVFLEGSGIAADSGYLKNEDCVKQLLHEEKPAKKDGGNVSVVHAAHPASKYVGPPGTTFSVFPGPSETRKDLWGSKAVEVYRWDNGELSGTANNGTEDPGCPGSPCGKTVYFSGAYRAAEGYGIQNETVRMAFMKGVLDWFFEPPIRFEAGLEENGSNTIEITGPRFNATTILIGESVRFSVNVSGGPAVDTVEATLRYPNGTEVPKVCVAGDGGYFFDWNQTYAAGNYQVTCIRANDTLGRERISTYADLGFEAEFPVSGVSIEVVDNSVDLGVGSPAAGTGTVISSNETNGGGWESNVGGFVIRNKGFMNVKLRVYSDKTAGEFIGGSNPAYRFASYEPSKRPGCAGGLQEAWADMTQTPATAKTVCCDLGHSQGKDQVGVNIQLYVPADAPVKEKSQSTLTFVASMA